MKFAIDLERGRHARLSLMERWHLICAEKSSGPLPHEAGPSTAPAPDECKFGMCAPGCEHDG